MPFFDSLRSRTLVLVFVGLAALFLSLVALSQRFPLPSDDAVDYLKYARSLHVSGSFSETPSGPAADQAPGREPLYSVVIAGLARVLPGFGRALTECRPPRETCKAGLRPLVFANAALLAIAAGFVVATVLSLGGSRMAGIISGLYLVLNFDMLAYLKYTYSDFLSLGLLAALSFALVRAVAKPWRMGLWLPVGILLALLVLTKQTFLPYAVAVLVALMLSGIVGLRAQGGRALLPAGIVGLVLLVIVGGWFTRNVRHFGTAFDARGAMSLSMREVFNEMGPRENLAAFVMWTRGPGDNIAKKLFPEHVTQKFNQKNPHGYFLRGHVTNAMARVGRIQAEQGVSQAVAHARASRAVLVEIAQNVPGYILSMPALFYRGLWFDEFIVIGFPLLLMTIIASLRRREWTLLAALSPSIYSLLVYPAVSLNIPRYQIPAVVGLAIAAGLSLAAIFGRWRDRSQSRT